MTRSFILLALVLIPLSGAIALSSSTVSFAAAAIAHPPTETTAKDAPPPAVALSDDPAAKVARAYLAACTKSDAEALNALFLDKGRATVSENAGDEGTWETYRDHHLLPELKEMPGFEMVISKEDVRSFGSTGVVRHIGTFSVPDPNHKELTKKYLAAVTYVVVDDGGTPRIAHLHWSSRAEKPPEAKTEAAGKTVNKTCPMTGDPVNDFHTREFKGQTVGFCDGDCALRWDGLSEEVRAAKLAAAIAGTTEKTPHGAQQNEAPKHDHK